MNIVTRLNQLMEKGESICLATVIASKKANIAVGAKAIVFGDGSMEGNLGTEQSDLRARDLALTSLNEKKCRAVEI